MGYKEYVENAIMESVEEDLLDEEEIDTLMDVCESAESADDLEAVEEYLTEAKHTARNNRNKKNKAQALEKRKEREKTENDAEKDAEDHIRTGTALIPTGMSRDGRARVDRLRQKKMNEDFFDMDKRQKKEQKNGVVPIGREAKSADLPAKRSSGTVAGKASATRSDVIDGTYREISTLIDNGCGKSDSNFSAGKIAVGAVALTAVVTGAALKIKSVIKKINSDPARKIMKQMKALEDQAKDVAKRCNKGEITAKEARLETKKIQAQMKTLAKEAAKIAKAESAVKESVDMDITDIQLAIYESCDEGEISEEDRDELLEMLEGTNIDQAKKGSKIFKDAKNAIRDAKKLANSGDISSAKTKLDTAISAMKKFRDEIKNYDDSLGEIICGQFLRTAILYLKSIAGILFTFGIGTVIATGDEIIKTLDGMIQMYQDDGFSFKMFNTNKARLISISTKLIKQAEKVKADLDTNDDSEATKESVDMDITDIQLAIYESCDEGEISEEDRDELLEMLEG